ncbi:MAG: hypothetical protein RL077_6361 [Verrucomicrobiota bacterium]
MVPKGGGGVVLRNAATGGIQDGQVILGFGEVLFGGAAIPGGALQGILSDTGAGAEENAEIFLGVEEGQGREPTAIDGDNETADDVMSGQSAGENGQSGGGERKVAWMKPRGSDGGAPTEGKQRQEEDHGTAGVQGGNDGEEGSEGGGEREKEATGVAAGEGEENENPGDAQTGPSAEETVGGGYFLGEDKLIEVRGQSGRGAGTAERQAEDDVSQDHDDRPKRLVKEPRTDGERLDRGSGGERGKQPGEKCERET